MCADLSTVAGWGKDYASVQPLFFSSSLPSSLVSSSPTLHLPSETVSSRLAYHPSRLVSSCLVYLHAHSHAHSHSYAHSHFHAHLHAHVHAHYSHAHLHSHSHAHSHSHVHPHANVHSRAHVHLNSILILIRI